MKDYNIRNISELLPDNLPDDISEDIKSRIVHEGLELLHNGTGMLFTFSLEYFYEQLKNILIIV